MEDKYKWREHKQKGVFYEQPHEVVNCVVYK